MSSSSPSRRKNADFIRACWYLGPYKGIVAVSILCALMGGLFFTSGLGAMLPILNVLINGQTVQDWMNRQIVEHRLHVRLTDDLSAVRVTRVDAKAEAKMQAGVLQIPSDGGWTENPQAVLVVLSDPQAAGVNLRIDSGPPAQISLPPMNWYLVRGRVLAGKFPIHPVKAVAAVFGVILALAVAGNTVRYFQEYLSDKAAILAINDIRRHLYDHVLHIPMSRFGLNGTSDVTSRLVSDAQGLQDGFKNILGPSIQEPINAALAFSLALWVSWKLTLFIVAFAPIMAILVKKFGKKMRRASRRALQTSSTMLGQIEGTLAGVRVVKAAGAERFERRRYSGIMNDLAVEQLKMSRIDAYSAPALETLTLVVVGAIVLMATYMVRMTQTLSATKFMLLMACLMMIGESLRRVSKLNNVLQKSNAAAARIFETLDLPVERPRLRGASPTGSSNGQPLPRLKLPPIRNEIRFENVCFAYPNSAQPALDGVNLIVPKGKSLAIVGRNGSGKTTLLALLLRFYEPSSGRIAIDGVDIQRASLTSLRRQISIVTQDSVIFPGSIGQNIAYNNPRAGHEQVVAAARRAFAHDFILEKPDAYDTLLGELGGQLSGGQKQRLCIARAILKQAPILILDEATSQVDAESEHLIQQAIESLMHERTTFVIAHRFSTILSADEIVVMDRGRIVGQGKHEDLLRSCPTYEQLYERQL